MKKLILFIILSVVPGYAQTKPNIKDLGKAADKAVSSLEKSAKELGKTEDKPNLDLTKDERDQLLILQLKSQNLQLQEQALINKAFGQQEAQLNNDNQVFVQTVLADHKLDPNKYVFDEQAGVLKPLNSAPANETKK